MRKGSYRLFLTVFIGMVLAGVGLIVLVSGLVETGSTLRWGLSTALGLALLGCAVAVRHVRPDRVEPGPGVGPG